jgi:hypothetical protein
MDVQKALAVLLESGIELTKAQTAALAEFKAATLRDAAIAKFDKALIQSADSSEWTTDMFTLAEKFASECEGENKGRGRGDVHERVFSIDTPSGLLKVSLTNPATDK